MKLARILVTFSIFFLLHRSNSDLYKHNMLDFEVSPEQSIWNDKLQIILGQPLQQTVSLLQQNDSLVKSVEVMYADHDPYKSDVILNLANDGIRLIFDGPTQRLRIIEIYQMHKVKLRYQGVYFNYLEQVLPTLDQIDRCFGATHPGLYDEEKQTFDLAFRGLLLTFHLSQKAETNFHQGICSLQFPSNAAPVVSRMQLYCGGDIASARAPPMPLCCFFGNCYGETVKVERVGISSSSDGASTTGITLSCTSQGGDDSLRFSDRISKQFSACIRFGDCVQEVLSALGAPSDVYYKSGDSTKFCSNTPPPPMSGKPLRRSLEVPSTGAEMLDGSLHGDAGSSDYFYNYFTLGLDVLFDGRTHRAIKFILHTNMPGSYDFNQYYRCEFSLALTSSCKVKTSSRWSNVVQALTAPVGKPVVLHRHGSLTGALPSGISSTAPAIATAPSSTVAPSGPIAVSKTPGPAPTLCYGVQDCIFEVLPSDYIATVTLYSRQLTQSA